MKKYHYGYAKRYGSPKLDEKELGIRNLATSNKGLDLMIEVDGLAAGFLHEISLGELKSKDGKPLLGDVAYYQVNKLR